MILKTNTNKILKQIKTQLKNFLVIKSNDNLRVFVPLWQRSNVGLKVIRKTK